MNEIASRYANGLYSIAYDSNKVNVWQEEIKTIQKLFLENREFLDVLSSAFLPLEEKEEMLDKTLRGVDPNIVNLVKLLVKNHRQRYILDTFQAYNSLANQARGVKEGLIYSTYRLDDKTLDKIKQKVKEVEGCEVDLINIIDPTLIGGIRVVIDGHIYDGSIKSHLAKLKESLLK